MGGKSRTSPEGGAEAKRTGSEASEHWSCTSSLTARPGRDIRLDVGHVRVAARKRGFRIALSCSCSSLRAGPAGTNAGEDLPPSVLVFTLGE
jgi:hypothetical protein